MPFPSSPLNGQEHTEGDYTWVFVAATNSWNFKNITVEELGFVPSDEIGVADGIAPLDSGAKVPLANLPDSVKTGSEYKGAWNATTNAPLLADGVGNNGDYYRVDTAGTQDLGSGSIDFAVGDLVTYNGTLLDWQRIGRDDAVTSVAAKTGDVVLAKADVGLDQVDNTADTAKPVSILQQAALDLKADASAVSNVDNTSDADKPVSTAQQTALDLKEDTANKGVANGYAPLDASSLVPLVNLPPISGGLDDWDNPPVNAAVVLPDTVADFGPGAGSLDDLIPNGVEFTYLAGNAAYNPSILIDIASTETAIYAKPTSLPNPGGQGIGFVITNSIPPSLFFFGFYLMRDGVDDWYIRDMIGGTFGGPYQDFEILNQNIAFSASENGTDLFMTIRVGGSPGVPDIQVTRNFASYESSFNVPPGGLGAALMGLFGGDALNAPQTIDWLETPIVAYTGVDQWAAAPTLDASLLDDGAYIIRNLSVPSAGSPVGQLTSDELVVATSGVLTNRGVKADIYDPASNTNFSGNNSHTGEEVFAGDVLLGGKVIDKVNLQVFGAENLGTLDQFTSYVVEVDSPAAAATATLPSRDDEGGGDNLVYVHMTLAGYAGGKVTLSSDGTNFWEAGSNTSSSTVDLFNGDDVLFVSGPSLSGDVWHILGRSSGGATINDSAGDGNTTEVWSANKIFDELALKEDALGNPGVNGDVLASTTGGVRSWVTPLVINDSAGDGVTTQAWSANKIFDELASRDSAINAKEPGLGNPATNGEFLVSDTGGNRSFTTLPAGTSMDVLLFNTNLTGGILITIPNRRYIGTTSDLGSAMLLPLPAAAVVGDRVILQQRVTECINTVSAQGTNTITEYAQVPQTSVTGFAGIKYAEFIYTGSNNWDLVRY